MISPETSGFDNAGFQDATAFAAHHADRFLKSHDRANQDKMDDALALDWIETPLGSMLAICDKSHLFMLEFTARKAMERQFDKLHNAYGRDIKLGRTDITAQITDELASYFAGELTQFQTPFMPIGTDFQKSVWQQLCQITYGQTRSYTQLAQMTGNPKAVRAVASANARNGLAIIIPCHRVISHNGGLGGYAGGVSRKEQLLSLER